MLIILVRRRGAEEESGEGKLEGGGVTIDHLGGDVLPRAVPLSLFFSLCLYFD